MTKTKKKAICECIIVLLNVQEFTYPSKNSFKGNSSMAASQPHFFSFFLSYMTGHTFQQSPLTHLYLLN